MFLNPWYSVLQQGGQQQQNPSTNPPPGTENPGNPENLPPSNNHLAIENNIVNNLTSTSSPAPSPRLPRSNINSNNPVTSTLGLSAFDLEEAQKRLRPGWTIHVTPEGRFYYCK
jgi:hypothetical protein